MNYFQRNKGLNASSTAVYESNPDHGDIFNASKPRAKTKFKSIFLPIVAGALLSNAALAEVEVAMYKVTETGQGTQLGTVTLTENQHGVIFTPKLTNLSAGMHGFHVHQYASCEPKKEDGKIVPGGAAGGHMDAKATHQHDTPWGEGHSGDLPALYVDNNGTAESAVLAPRLTLKLLDKHALMIHENGDNYADEPKPLGGGGKRIACGVIETD